MINIMILAAADSNKADSQEDYPLCLNEIDGESLLECIVNKTSGLETPKYVFTFLGDDVERFHLDRVASLLSPNSLVVKMAKGSQGAACSGLYSACQLDQDPELLIISANELVNVDYQTVISDFRERKLDAGTIIFRSLHPRYSYVRLDSDGYVIETTQHNPITKNATAGVFWFRKTSYFVEAVKKQILKNASNNGKFYVAPCLNELILLRLRIGVFEIDNDRYIPLKTKNQQLALTEG